MSQKDDRERVLAAMRRMLRLKSLVKNSNKKSKEK
jgi:hypothetical protein